MCIRDSGSSITAVKDGECVDTSMGFTPLDGIIMGTRSGGVDPSVVTYLMNKEGLTPDEMSDILNKKSGFLGLSGLSSDARDRVKMCIRDSCGIKRLSYILLCRTRRQEGAFYDEKDI